MRHRAREITRRIEATEGGACLHGERCWVAWQSAAFSGGRPEAVAVAEAAEAECVRLDPKYWAA